MFKCVSKDSHESREHSTMILDSDMALMCVEMSIIMCKVDEYGSQLLGITSIFYVARSEVYRNGDGEWNSLTDTD